MKDKIVRSLKAFAATRWMLPFVIYYWRGCFAIKNRLLFQSRLRRCKYVHLMFNDKFNKPFVDFLNRHFEPAEHFVLCKRTCKEFPFPVGKNVIEVRTFRGFNFNQPNISKVICHSLFDDEVVDLLYKQKTVLQEKACWVMWGGDLYNAKRDAVNDFVREKIGCRCTVSDMDKDIAEQKYGKAKTFLCGYTCPTTAEMIVNMSRKRSHDSVNIQINNSCDSSILPMLENLSRYARFDVNVWTVLSYGDVSKKDAVIDRGRELFGEKFHYLDHIMSPVDFVEHMSEMDILVLNQERQQGLGNAFLAAALGVKIFIRSDISSFSFLLGRGVRCFDTLHIGGESIEDFVSMSSGVKKENIRAGLAFFDLNELAKLWHPVFCN